MGEPFCGLLGGNGIGKSSVLESLDCYFNGKTWNYHISTKKSGLASSNPSITPIFLIKKTELDHPELLEVFESLSSTAWEMTEEDVALTNRPRFKEFIAHRTTLKKYEEDYYLLPIGVDHQQKPSLSIFNCKKVGENLFKDNFSGTTIEEPFLTSLQPLLDILKNKFEYIYIPRDMDVESFTKLETAEIQALMGETLSQIIEQRVTPDQIKEINGKLNEFLDGLSSDLGDYAYRTITDRQQNLRKNDIYNLIIDAFFKIRKLHRRQGDHWLEIAALSSGEKQKAIIDVAYSLLKKHENSRRNLIMAVDEPESSLHMSACYDQFSALYEISKSCAQFIFSTHWYGFLPTVEKGVVSVISKKDDSHLFDLINIRSYREEIKQKIKQSKGTLPHDIRLKSINDFVQSIIASLIHEEPYNWIICEGSSEKIYFENYFSDLLSSRKLRIIPVGGAAEIKKLYGHLDASLEEFKNEISGKIVLISDTDPELVSYPTNSHPSILCRRIVNVEKDRGIKLVKMDANPVSPKTEIEDALNGKLAYETLMKFKEAHPVELDFLVDGKEVTEESTHFSFDLSPSQSKKLNAFFDFKDNKLLFAQEYVKNINGGYEIPSWIKEIRAFLEE